MRALAFAAAFVALCTSAAFASGFGDFNAGITARNRDALPDTVRFLSLAISKPDLPAHLLPVAHVARGEAYFLQKNYDAAIADFTAAMALRKDYLDAILDRCAAYGTKEQFAPALADCSTAIQLDPDNWPLRKIRIAIYREQKRYDDAIGDYTLYLAKHPGKIQIKLEYADLLREAGRFADAIAVASSARAGTSVWYNAAVDVSLASIYLDTGDFRSALDHLNAVDKVLRKNTTIAFARGEIEWALGRYGDAQDAFDDSLDYDETQQYSFLWLVIARARDHDSLQTSWNRRIAKQDLSKWPGPLVGLYLGNATAEDILKQSANESDYNRCAANFFVGEWYLFHDNPTEGKRLVGLSASDCKDWKMKRFSQIELARLP